MGVPRVAVQKQKRRYIYVIYNDIKYRVIFVFALCLLFNRLAGPCDSNTLGINSLAPERFQFNFR